MERRPLSFGWRTCQQVNGKSADQSLPAFWGSREDRVYVLYQALQWTPPCVCSQVQRGQEQVSVLTMLSDTLAPYLTTRNHRSVLVGDSNTLVRSSSSCSLAPGSNKRRPSPKRTGTMPIWISSTSPARRHC